MRGMTIKNGVIINVAVFESEETLFDGWEVSPDGIGPGYTDNGDGTFSPPPPDPE